MEIGCLMGALSLLALEDLRIKKIPIIPLVLTGIVGMIFHLVYCNRDIRDIVGGIFIGIALYLLSVITGGKIGKGDGVLFMVTGVYLGFWNNLMMLWIACVMAGIVGTGMVVVFKKNKNYKLPFVPFVLIAALVMLIAGKGKFA